MKDAIHPLFPEIHKNSRQPRYFDELLEAMKLDNITKVYGYRIESEYQGSVVVYATNGVNDYLYEYDYGSCSSCDDWECNSSSTDDIIEDIRRNSKFPLDHFKNKTSKVMVAYGEDCYGDEKAAYEEWLEKEAQRKKEEAQRKQEEANRRREILYRKTVKNPEAPAYFYEQTAHKPAKSTTNKSLVKRFLTGLDEES